MNNYDKGLEILKKIANEENIQAISGLAEIHPDLAEKVISFGFGEIYSRPNLDLRSREIVTLTSLITQGTVEQLDFHIQVALNVGLKQEEILEIGLHCAAYVGFPKAINAIMVIGRFFKNNNLKLNL